jgi:hypothetical protein
VLLTGVSNYNIDYKGIGNLSKAIRRWEMGRAVGRIGTLRV